MNTAHSSDSYGLGRSAAETERLIRQAQIYGPLTRQVFVAAGITSELVNRLEKNVIPCRTLHSTLCSIARCTKRAVLQPPRSEIPRQDATQVLLTLADTNNGFTYEEHTYETLLQAAARCAANRFDACRRAAG